LSGLVIQPATLPWAICAGIAVGSLVYTAARPYRRLGPRLHAYTAVARSRLGSGTAEVVSLSRSGPAPLGGIVARVLGPILAAVAHQVAVVGGTRDEEQLRLQLYQAGITDVTPRDYQLQQLLYAALGAAGGVVVTPVVGARLGILMGIAGFMLGPTRKRAQLNRRIKLRQERMRGELLSMCQVLAVYSRAIPNPQQITEQVVGRSRGEVARELRGVLHVIEAGTQPEVAFAQAAELTPEPAAGRLYRAIATAVASGGDIAGSLLAQSEDVREAQRQSKIQQATRRKAVLVMSTVVLMGPPILVFIAAPFPRLILGH